MLTPEQLAAYFENRLEPFERVEVERALAEDATAQYTLADQLNLDLALRVLLGRPEAHERVKASIFTVLRGEPEASLAAGILRDAGNAAACPPQAGFAHADLVPPGSDGSCTAATGGAWGRRWAHAWRRLLDSPWRWGGASAVALVVVVWTLAGLWPTRPALGPEIGQFHVVVGEPTLAVGSGRGPLPAQVSTAVHLGDRVETGDADRAELRFHDGTTLRLAFNTTVEFAAPPGPPRGTTNALLRPPEIRLLQGQVWTQVAKRTNAPTYAIRTEAATAIARGTEFGVRLQRVDATAMNSPLATVLTVKEGAVDFTNALGSVRATAMTECRAQVGSAPTEPKRLQTLQVVRLPDIGQWSVLSAALDWPEAAERLVAGGGWAGLRLRALPSAATTSNAGGAAETGVEVRVAQLGRGTPAEQAGLRLRDTLIRLDGTAITNVAQVYRAILEQPGRELVLRIRRDGTEQEIRLTPQRRQASVPGAQLSALEQARLAAVSPAFFARPTVEAGGAGVEGSASLRAAALNNRGVAAELHDAMGPAIRAYRRAVVTDTGVALYRYNLGLALRKIGSFERAAEELGEACRLAPGSSEARKRLAEVRSLLGDDAGALQETETALANAPQEHGLWELKAQILTKQGRLAEATLAARRAVDLDGGCAVARAYLGTALANQKNSDAAEAEFQMALELAPFEAPIHNNFGAHAMAHGKADAAEQAFRRAIELEPGFALAHRNLGQALLDRGDFTAAAVEFQLAATLEPDDVATWRGVGEAALKRRRWDEAEAAYRRALELAPDDPETWYGLGETHRMRQRPQEAEAAYRKALERKPDLAFAHTSLGIVLYQQGAVDEAEKEYRQAIALKPADPAPYHNLGNLARDARRDLDAAERWFRQALQRSPNDGETLGGLGLVAAARGDLAEAERLTRQALGRLPQDSALHNNLGEVLRQRGELDEAEKSYRRALQLEPANPAPYGNLGILQAGRGQFAEAEKTFRELVQRSTGETRVLALLNLANLRAEQKDLAEAEQFFREALRLVPGDPRVAQAFASFLADHQRHLDEAQSLALQALRAAPQEPGVLGTLGWVLAQRGDLEAAERTLRRALERAGQDPAAAEIRVHLEQVQHRRAPQAHPPSSTQPTSKQPAPKDP